VRQKTLEQALLQETRERYGVCEAEAGVVVQRGLEYLRSCGQETGLRAANQVVLELPGRQNETGKQALSSGTRKVAVTPVGADDLDVWEEFGARAMQTARLLRVVEEADRSGCTVPLAELARLVPLSRQAVSRRLAELWRAGYRLPVQGSRTSCGGSRSRLGEVLASHLQGRVPTEARKTLALSPGGWEKLLWNARSAVAGLLDGEEPEAIAARLQLSSQEVESLRKVLRRVDGSPARKERLTALLARGGERKPGPWNGSSLSRLRFESLLIREHSFSRARALLYADMVEAKAVPEVANAKPTELVYYALAADEPGGKELAACRRVAVALPYVLPEDYASAGKSTDIKRDKVVRFAVAAKAQGGLLTLPDLAYLVGLAPQTVGRLIDSADVYVPTRGRECDLGPGLSHKTRIVQLYVEGYTEVEVSRRTHHSLDAVAAYLRDFTIMMVLSDRGLPAAHIRKVSGRSRRLVDAYLELYRSVDTPENQWKLNLMRRGFEARVEKKREA